MSTATMIESPVPAASIVARYQQRLWEALEISEAAAARGTKALYPALMALENLLMCDLLTDDEQDSLVQDPALQNFIRRSWKLFCELELDIEKNLVLLFSGREASELLFHRPGNVMHNYLTRFNILVRKEIALAGITPASRVLMIGSGYFPSTAIALASQAACRIDCVDFVAEAWTASRKLIAKMGLDDRITIIKGRGEEQDCSRYDVVLVGCLAQPKRKIMANLAATAAPHCRVVCRTTLGARSFMWKPVGPGELEPYRPVRSFRATGTQHLSSVLVQL
jgi:nicotianamine synthase-like protein